MADEKQAMEDLIHDAVTKGAILAVMYFDVSSNDKAAVQPSLTELVAKISKEPGLISAVGEISEPIEVEEMWTSGAEVTILVKSFTVLANISIRYGPIGIEVMKPDKINLSLGEAQGMLLNISQVGQDFAQYIITQGMNEFEKDTFRKQQSARIAAGKKLIEESGKETEGKE
ncbi:Uncharacterised protein [uncultured archaeon]|nr:Uncharacterised protein [uncultured archaeon]